MMKFFWDCAYAPEAPYLWVVRVNVCVSVESERERECVLFDIVVTYHNVVVEIF